MRSFRRSLSFLLETSLATWWLRCLFRFFRRCRSCNVLCGSVHHFVRWCPFPFPSWLSKKVTSRYISSLFFDHDQFTSQIIFIIIINWIYYYINKYFRINFISYIHNYPFFFFPRNRSNRCPNFFFINKVQQHVTNIIEITIIVAVCTDNVKVVNPANGKNIYLSRLR